VIKVSVVVARVDWWRFVGRGFVGGVGVGACRRLWRSTRRFAAGERTTRARDCATSPERGKFALDEQTTRAAASAHTIGESTTRDDDTPERSD
jgi:hypothetical protein